MSGPDRLRLSLILKKSSMSSMATPRSLRSPHIPEDTNSTRVHIPKLSYAHRSRPRHQSTFAMTRTLAFSISESFLHGVALFHYRGPDFAVGVANFRYGLTWKVHHFVIYPLLFLYLQYQRDPAGLRLYLHGQEAPNSIHHVYTKSN